MNKILYNIFSVATKPPHIQELLLKLPFSELAFAPVCLKLSQYKEQDIKLIIYLIWLHWWCSGCSCMLCFVVHGDSLGGGLTFSPAKDNWTKHVVVATAVGSGCTRIQ